MKSVKAKQKTKAGKAKKSTPREASNSLEQYSKKRDFSKSSEPEGSIHASTSRYPRFVVQEHHARRLHYDFRLECNGVLKSWAVTKEPVSDPMIKRLAVETEDHPVDYLEFQGVIEPGNYGAGVVKIWDSGTYGVDGASDKSLVEEYVSFGSAKGHLKVKLNGKKLVGDYALVRLEDGKNWLFFKTKDKVTPKTATSPTAD